MFRSVDTKSVDKYTLCSNVLTLFRASEIAIYIFFFCILLREILPNTKFLTAKQKNKRATWIFFSIFSGIPSHRQFCRFLLGQKTGDRIDDGDRIDGDRIDGG